MAETPNLRVATTNEIQLSSRSGDRNRLRLIGEEGKAVNKEQPVLRDQDIPDRVKTLQGLVQAEVTFLTALREQARQICRFRQDEERFSKLISQLNHDNIFSLARFFFLLKATRCDNPTSIEAFLKDHNQKIRTLIETQDFAVREERELKKAAFSGGQIHDCVDSVGMNRRALFTRAEIAKLLFDHMSRDSVLRMIDALVDAGLLNETVYEPLKGANRTLLQTDGFLENAVAQYLSDVKDNV